MSEIPVKDSPETPTTPSSPTDISRSARVPDIGPDSSPAYKEEPKSEGLKGVWRVKQNHGPHRDVLAFKPASKAEAQAFLSQPAFKLPPGVSRLCDTPRSSRTGKWSRRTEKMRCHGCHALMGAGAHLGSATGKANCTFLHNPSCPGGIVEDVTWNACPQGYIFQGFDHTMSSQDFRTQNVEPALSPAPTNHYNTSPVYATPSLSEEQVRQERERLARQQLGEGSRPKETSSTQVQQLDTEMQRNMDSHRALNQNQSTNVERPPMEVLTITNLRADPEQQRVVSDQISGFRERIPSLSAAPTAAVPATVSHASVLQ